MRVAVIGGGLAGLAAACELTDRGHRVVLYERRPWCGGKTYSFRDEETGAAVDNGQHVFMTCTTGYVDFLRRLGTLHLTRRQRVLSVRVFDARGRESSLRARRLPAPLHLAWAFFRYRHLPAIEKLRVAWAMLAVLRLPAGGREELAAVSFGAWLRERGQSERGIADFWDFLVLPTLNARCDDAAARAALFVLQEGFLRSAGAAAIGIPAVGLSALHVDPAVRLIEAGGGSVRTRSAVEGVVLAGGRARAVVLAAGATEPCDAVVCAVPPSAVSPLFPEHAAEPPFAGIAAIRMAPIVNVHLWFDRSVADWPFAAFAGNELQWVFNRERLDRTPVPGAHRLVVSLSGAASFMPLSKAEIEARLLPQVRASVPGAKDAVLLRSTVIKEPGATFVPSPGLVRPGPRTPFENVVLAGAYTATGWPATMESAVRSGREAARTLHVSCAGATSAGAAPGR